jgi:hypothetical protein
VYEAMRSPARQVEKLTQEMMTLKFFVAATPGAARNAQAVRKALTRSKKPRQRQRAARRIREANEVIDELEGLAREFAEAARR